MRRRSPQDVSLAAGGPRRASLCGGSRRRRRVWRGECARESWSEATSGGSQSAARDAARRGDVRHTLSGLVTNIAVIRARGDDDVAPPPAYRPAHPRADRLRCPAHGASSHLPVIRAICYRSMLSLRSSSTPRN